MNPGRLVILSGPSGVGKDTVIDAWIKADPGVERVVAYTTRRPRETEKNGVDYWFVSKPEFRKMVRDRKFLEHKKVHKNHYATPAEHTDRILAEGRIAVLKIDVQGAGVVMKKRRDAMSVFLLPPDFDTLRERLENPTTGKRDDIPLRLEVAAKEIAMSKKYKVRIVNDKVDDVVAQLRELTTR
jgi:guanylate kinase